MIYHQIMLSLKFRSFQHVSDSFNCVSVNPLQSLSKNLHIDLKGKKLNYDESDNEYDVVSAD